MPDPLITVTAAGATNTLGAYAFEQEHNDRPVYLHIDRNIRIWWGKQIYPRWILGIRLDYYGTDVYYQGEQIYKEYYMDLIPLPTAGPWELGGHPDAAEPLPTVELWMPPLSPGADNLLIEGLGNPTRVMNPTPDITWDYQPGACPGDQAAYQILAATAPELLEPGETDLWDSGVQETSATMATYAGQPLGDNEMVFYRVMVRDPDGIWSYP